MKNLVVVASHGEEYSSRFLEKAGDKYPILIVRTDLPDEKIRNDKFDYTPYKGFDTGAYLWAYWNHPADRYLFLQDSMIPQTEDYGDIVFSKLDNNDVVVLAGFPFPMWDNAEQACSAAYYFGEVNPPRGVFGPNFAISRLALNRLAENNLLPMPPIHKHSAQGKEREWAMAFELAHLKVHYLHEWSVWIKDLYPFTKIYGGRS